MELDLECVAGFLALCEEGHYGRASSRLHLTSSALTKRVQRLEHQIGVQLVERGPSGTSALTAAGWQFLPRAKALLDLARSAQAASRSAARVPIREIVRVGVPGVLASDPSMETFMRPMIALRGWIPGATILSKGVPYGRAINALLEHQVDILWSPSVFEHPGLTTKRLGTALRVGVVPIGHPFAVVGTVNVEEFSSLPLLYNPSVPPELMAPGWLGDVRPRSEARLVATESQGITALKKAIIRGDGMAVLPWVLGMKLGAGLRSVILEGVPLLEVHAIYRSAGNSVLVKKVLDLLGMIAATTEQQDFPMAALGTIEQFLNSESYSSFDGQIQG